jgi:CubicO group peptidase (beta-lactamase class C family)
VKAEEEFLAKAQRPQRKRRRKQKEEEGGAFRCWLSSTVLFLSSFAVFAPLRETLLLPKAEEIMSLAVPMARPETIGFDPQRLRRAEELLARWVAEDRLPAAALCVGRQGRIVEPRFFGRQQPDAGAPALASDALFLVASITKPVTATAVMLLVERGVLSLEDHVTSFLPAFAAHGKEGVQVHHLLTHTSGLPDMVTDNEALRKAHKPLADFVEAACREKPLFPPGTKVNYQSAGSAVLAEIVHQVTGTTLADFLRKEVFEPLGMTDTSLGWQKALKGRIAGIRLDEETRQTDWNWNSPYWLGLGAPWGGLITSPTSLARFCAMLLRQGKWGDRQLLSPQTVRAMTSNQLAAMPLIPEEDRRCRPWGLGWRLNWPAQPGSFGDLLGPRAFGHWGASGTMCWIDPDSDAFCIVFTTQPLEPESRLLARISNVVCAAIVSSG